MTASFDQLPFDILFYIALNLDIEDIVHLSQLCRQLYALTGEQTLCRRMVEDNYPYAEEAQYARQKRITYRQALYAIYNRRRAFSDARPFSARTLGQGQAFLSRQDTVCILEGGILRTFDTVLQRAVSRLDLANIATLNSSAPAGFFERQEIELLNYSHGIIVIHFASKVPNDNGYVFAMRVGKDVQDNDRVIKLFQPTSCSKLFVRHNAQYLCYGTHSGEGDDGHHKWQIFGLKLDRSNYSPKKEQAIMLEDFHGNDIGSTVAFEIHENCFYAVSNQGTFEVEEIDYTSFYHWVRFPVDNPVKKMIEKDDRLYRRQHRQGPIHDSWTDLTLQVDERTNEIVIVESRREWAQSSSRQSRTFYITKLEPHCNDEQLLPEDDAFVALNLIDSSNNPHYKPTPDLYSWSQHPEFASDDPNPRSFILARTKVRGYNYSCSSFLDLVEDDRCCNDPTKPPCLRLRIGSRRQYERPQQHQHSTHADAKSKGKQRVDSVISLPHFIDTTTTYHQPSIRMWPPAAPHCPCSAHLHEILNSSLDASASHARSITGVLDERRLVYMVKPGRSYGTAGKDNTLGTVVLVDFSKPPGVLLASCERENNEECCGLKWEWTAGMEKRCREGTCRGRVEV